MPIEESPTANLLFKTDLLNQIEFIQTLSPSDFESLTRDQLAELWSFAYDFVKYFKNTQEQK